MGLDLGSAQGALLRSWAFCPGKWGVTKEFKQGSDMMKICCWKNKSVSNEGFGLVEGEIGGRKTYKKNIRTF